MESQKHSVEKAQPVELESVYIKVQPLLALRAFRATHPDLSIDVDHPRDNPHEIQNLAITEWNEKYAARFETFAREHAHDQLDLNNPEELDRLFTLMLASEEGTLEPDTIH